MEQRYIKDISIPFYDTEVSELINEYQVEGGGNPMDIGVENEKGELYRLVRCWGLGEYMHFTQGMLRLGFIDLLTNSTSQNGLDNIFAPTNEVFDRKKSNRNHGATIFDELSSAKDSLECLSETERDSVIKSRLGQGIFRQQLIKYWQGCAVTNATLIPMLRASHIKPWHASSNDERLDMFNGFLLSPALDAAFDCGLITFDHNGRIILSKKISGAPAYEFHLSHRMRINQKKFTQDHRAYLTYHHEYVFVSG